MCRVQQASLAPSELSNEHSDGAATAFSHGIHQTDKEMCRYFENHEKKLSTK